MSADEYTALHPSDCYYPYIANISSLTSPPLPYPALSGKPRPKSINDEIPFPSLKDEALLAKWRLDRPVSISRNGHNLGPYDDDVPPEVSEILTRRLASCDEYDDEEDEEEEDDEQNDDDDDVPELRRVHVEEVITMERVKLIGQGMPRGAGAGAGPFKGLSSISDKAEAEIGGDRESGKSFLLSESECSGSEIERAMSAVDDSFVSQGRVSRGGSKSSILGLGLGGAEAAEDADDALETETASSSADDAGQMARNQSMFSSFFRKLNPARRKSYNAQQPL
jgi:hypothetical protein